VSYAVAVGLQLLVLYTLNFFGVVSWIAAWLVLYQQALHSLVVYDPLVETCPLWRMVYQLKFLILVVVATKQL
jgi:hypothetical protein